MTDIKEFIRRLPEEEQREIARMLAALYPQDAQDGLNDHHVSSMPDPDAAVLAIANVYGYTLQQLTERSKTGPGSNLDMLRCRATIVHVLNHKLLFGIGRPEIGRRWLGGRDNSTIISTIKNHFVRDALYYLAITRVCEVTGWGANETIECLEGSEATGGSTSGSGDAGNE
jgi:hypothetical protein